MYITRTAIIHAPFKGRFTDRRIAELCAEKLNAKLCSLRYTNTGIECSFGYGVYCDDELFGINPDEYIWVKGVVL